MQFLRKIGFIYNGSACVRGYLQNRMRPNLCIHPCGRHKFGLYPDECNVNVNIYRRQKGIRKNDQCRKFEKPSLDSEMTVLLGVLFLLRCAYYQTLYQGCGKHDFSYFFFSLVTSWCGHNFLGKHCIHIGVKRLASIKKSS
jgi:hypothetical protein